MVDRVLRIVAPFFSLFFFPNVKMTFSTFLSFLLSFFFRAKNWNRCEKNFTMSRNLEITTIN